MDISEIRKRVETEYTRSMMSDKRIAAIERKAKKTYKDASIYASKSGTYMGKALVRGLEESFDEDGIPEEVATALIPSALKANYKNVSAIAMNAQESMNTDAGVGLAALVPEFDNQKAMDIAEEVAKGYSSRLLINECENASRKIVDDSMRINAEAHGSAGMKVTVTRIYDGVGLSSGRVCEWCLERCGENMSYQEAYSKGAFQRHPGCGCEILYTTGKRTQRQTNWTKNQWEEIEESATIETRKETGIKKSFDIREKEKIAVKYIGVSREKLINDARREGGIYHGLIPQSEGKTKKELRDSINSHVARVIDHIKKLEDPAGSSERYRNATELGRQGIINHWERDRRRNAETAIIEMEIYKERFGE